MATGRGSRQRTLAQRVATGERGASIILIALSMVVLLGFAAIAVDVASIHNERRNSQSAADVGDLAGAQFLYGVGSTTAKTLAETEVRRISAFNLGTTDAEWDGCADPDRPAEFSEIALNTQCISWRFDFTQMRVRVPDQSRLATFGRVLGTDRLFTSAFAHVGIEGGGPRAFVLPFGLPPTAGGEVCLKTGPQPFPEPPCDGPTEGNFGFLDFKRYQWTSPNNCSTNFVEENIQEGIDHYLQINSAVPGAIHEFAGPDPGCPNPYAGPDRTEEQNGTTNNLHRGLVDGSTYAGRLTRVPPTGWPGGPWPSTPVMGHDLDDKPLWDFILYDLAAHPSECDPAVITTPDPTMTAHDKMGLCLTEYDKILPVESRVPLFVQDVDGDPTNEIWDIQYSPRWAFVPRIHVNFGVPMGTGPYEFIEFVPVFLQTVYGDCNAGSCQEFNPAEGNTIPANKKATGVTAFALPDGSVPDEVLDDLFIEFTDLSYLLIR